jgi:cytidylate kinase
VTPPEAIAQAVERDLLRRDSLDSQTNRLQVSDGAIHIDTSELTLAEVVRVIVRLVDAAGLVRR